ncbi:MAG: MFS transporter [Rhizomicrobium sp.]
MSKDVRALVRDGRMTRFQIAAVIVCMAINALDGFDVLSIAFTGPQIAKEWLLPPTQLGLLFSSGLAGMMIGSLVLSPFADILGRRTVVLGGLSLITAGMLLCGLAHGLTELALLRVFTGLGIGALFSSVNTIVTEYASDKRKSLAIAIMAVGYPIGATVGGTIAVFLIAYHGWRSVFFFGASLSAVLIPVAFVTLPESLEFLLARRPRNALARLNVLLRRMGHAALAVLPEPATTGDEALGAFSVFDRAFFSRTLLIVCAYFLTMLPFYFMLNWTPKVLVDQGLSVSTGISGAVVMNGVGILGGLLFGVIANVAGLRQLTSLCMVLFFAAIAGFGAVGTNLTLLLILAAAVGFFMIAMISGLYAIIGAMYPVRVRNTGTGLVLGVGRLGAVIGPYIGGVLIAAGWSRPVYCAALAAPLLVAAILIRRVPLLFDTAGRPDAAK